MGVPTKMSLFMIGDLGFLSVYDIFFFFSKSLGAWTFEFESPLTWLSQRFVVQSSNHQFFGSPKQEKSSVSSAIMLLGAAFRPLYVSFLPGAAASLGRWQRHGNLQGNFSCLTATYPAVSRIWFWLDDDWIGCFFGGFYGGEMAETIRQSVKW